MREGAMAAKAAAIQVDFMAEMARVLDSVLGVPTVRYWGLKACFIVGYHAPSSLYDCFSMVWTQQVL
jgi:hypothetical protein